MQQNFHSLLEKVTDECGKSLPYLTIGREISIYSDPKNAEILKNVTEFFHLLLGMCNADVLMRNAYRVLVVKLEGR
jgi:hypothetical protein